MTADTFERYAKQLADLMRQWSHTDVVAIAAMIFLFMIQDAQTLTMVPEGAYAFYLFIAAGFAFLFMRWLIEIDVEAPKWAPFLRLIVCVSIYAVFIATVWGGVPGAAPHFSYRSIDSICKHAKPFLSKVKTQFPHSYGNCTDKDSKPPQPCIGKDNLQTQGDANNYMNAIWIGGLETMEVTQCSLTRALSQVPGESEYNFVIAGEFGKLPLFLRVRQCTAVGCVKMNSAKHCCGKHVSFNFTFGIDCKSVPGSMNAIRDLKLLTADFGKMIVHQDMIGGHLKVDAMDISNQVTQTVKAHIQDMLKATIPWGGHKKSVSDMLNKLVQYNAPSNVGTCF
jgi:hypothetical protein